MDVRRWMALLRVALLGRRADASGRVGRRRLLTATVATLLAPGLVPLASAATTTTPARMHKSGTASTDYSLLPTAAIQSNGTWSLSYVASVDYRFYASLPNGRVSPTIPVQAR
jgi:hypothetical protein